MYVTFNAGLLMKKHKAQNNTKQQIDLGARATAQAIDVLHQICIVICLCACLSGKK